MKSATNHRISLGNHRSDALDLHRVLTALGDLIADHESLRARADSLRKRIENQHFQLAVLGQFKRGKSTFINALLGAPLLPIAVVPLTAIPVFISWSSSPVVRVSFVDRRPDKELSTEDPGAISDFLFRFVSEEANPENHLGVGRVDLFYPAPILANGIILIDTPGVGSTFRHNTEAAFRVLPESDAAFFVISVDPPITEIEIEYLRHIKAKTAKLFFVLNKVDYLRPEERDRVIEFVRRTLEQGDLWPSDAAIFAVSAAGGLDAKQRGERVRLELSGIAQVERYILDDLAFQKCRLLDQAARTKVTDIIADAEAETRLRIRALEMPIEELASKCEAFQEALVSIERQRRTIRDLLEGERRRLRQQLEDRIRKLRDQAKTNLAGIIGEDDNLTPLSGGLTHTFDAARQEFSSSFTAAVDSALAEHQKRISGLTDEVRRTAGALFHTPFGSGFEPETFSLGEEPYWVTEKIHATLLPDPSGLVDRLVPNRIRQRRRRARVLQQVDELILRNAENLRWAILRGIDDTFRSAGFQFEQHLDQAIATTNGVVHEALERRHRCSTAAGSDLDSLRQKSEGLSDLARRLHPKEHCDPPDIQEPAE